MSYKGSDLSKEFKSFFRSEKKRITESLTKLGCTKIEMDYGFYFFSGFFTSKSGQIYYFSVSDVRHFSYDRIMYRTAKHYKDWTGGSNQWINKDTIEKMNLI
jgi:hypothetical protein